MPQGALDQLPCKDLLTYTRDFFAVGFEDWGCSGYWAHFARQPGIQSLEPFNPCTRKHTPAALTRTFLGPLRLQLGTFGHCGLDGVQFSGFGVGGLWPESN